MGERRPSIPYEFFDRLDIEPDGSSYPYAGQDSLPGELINLLLWNGEVLAEFGRSRQS